MLRQVVDRLLPLRRDSEIDLSSDAKKAVYHGHYRTLFSPEYITYVYGHIPEGHEGSSAESRRLYAWDGPAEVVVNRFLDMGNGWDGQTSYNGYHPGTVERVVTEMQDPRALERVDRVEFVASRLRSGFRLALAAAVITVGVTEYNAAQDSPQSHQPSAQIVER